MRFEFYMPEGYSEEDLLKLIEAYDRRKPVRYWGTILFRGFLVIFGFMMIAGGLMLTLSGNASPVSLVGMVAGVMWVTLGFLFKKFRTMKSRRAMLQNTGSVTITFDDCGALVQTEKGSTNYPYSSFETLVSYQDTWFVFLDDRHALILPESAMNQGVLGDFELFINGKIAK